MADVVVLVVPAADDGGRAGIGGPSSSSFSLVRSPCENRRFKNEVVEENLWLKFANDEIVAAGGGTKALAKDESVSDERCLMKELSLSLSFLLENIIII